MDLWIDWRDEVSEAAERSGSTYVFVMQPWLEDGYFLDFKNSTTQLEITLGLGREMNLITNGDVVAQDYLLLQCCQDLMKAKIFLNPIGQFIMKPVIRWYC